MAAPNLLNLASITGKTSRALLTTSLTAIVTNGASSSKVFKVNTIMVANIDGTNAQDVDDAITDASVASEKHLVKTLNVPADSSAIVVDKNTPIYLEEDMAISAKAGGTSDLEIVVSYEEMS